ncbi:MAG TPA: hypothetical protein VH111_09515, partial [Steroidobacteraceae bacterium]|nr:hypothetical protein [Steroidobacteraceae bacterium]
HQRVEPWWYFLPLLLLGVLPWIVPLARATWRAWREGRESREVAAAPAPFKPLEFLTVFAVVTLLFFSASGSKLAPYILPMMPVLAAVTGARAGDAAALARQAARIGAALILVVGAGLLVYSVHHNSYVPHEALLWVGASAMTALLGVGLTWRSRSPAGTSAFLTSSVTAILAWQCLMCAYTVIPPARSARELVRAVRPLITSSTPLYSVGQYRETLSPYLGRTLQLVDYEGELHFGLEEEPQRRLAPQDFATRWSAGGEAVAFFDPGVWDRWRRRGFPGRVIAADNYTVAVSRL